MKQLDNARLEELLEKERAHDDYLYAIRKVRQNALELRSSLPSGEPYDNFLDGFRAALHFIADAILEASRRRDPTNGGAIQDPPPHG